MTNDNTTAPGVAAPGAKAGRKRPGQNKPSAKAVGAAKETEAEQIIHELFRLAKVDLRASAHGTKLARDFASLLGKK
jgi:hypothetical protein